MATLIAISVEQYLATSYRPDVEYVDGELVERNVGEYDHSRLQSLVIGMLLLRERELGIRVLTEQRVRVVGASDRRRFRIPDVCVMSMSHARTPVIEEPPLAVIEILSPDDTVSAMLNRLMDFVHMGVPHVWLIDPASRRVWEATADGLRTVKSTEPNRLIDFHAVLAALDE